MGYRNDLRGKRCGKLTVLAFARNKSGRTYWRCRCDCGTEKKVNAVYLKSGNPQAYKSCGCSWRTPKGPDLAGRKIGWLLVIRPQGNRNNWVCRCVCGREVIKAAHSLNHKKVNSCGCKRVFHKTHGHCTKGRRTSEYAAWNSMLFRCYNPKAGEYKRYGARGIRVCRRWKKSFQNFIDDMGNKPTKTHSLDRIDNKKGYTPTNCRWSTPEQQSGNQRKSKYYTVGNTTMCRDAWARRYGINRGTLFGRLSRGWNIEEAVTTPIQKKEKLP